MKEPKEDAARIDLLKFFYAQSKTEISFLRERQDKIFSWSSSLLVIFIGAMVVIDTSKNLLWSSSGWVGKLMVSLTVLAITVFSVGWQQRNRVWQEENKLVVNRIATLLHCYDDGYYEISTDEKPAEALFVSRWKRAEGEKRKKNNTFWDKVLPVNYVMITWLLGLLTIVLVWIPRI